MRVEFSKHDRNGRQSVSWVALRGKRTVIPGTWMAVGSGIPHDLAQYVIEAAAHYENGFWGLTSKGATFKSAGRKLTKPGRAVIAHHRIELIESEALAGRHLEGWRLGEQSTVTHALNRAFDQWRQLGMHEGLVFEWPSPFGTVRNVSLTRAKAFA